MALSIEHWRKTWNQTRNNVIDGDAGKTLNLLANYAGFSKTFLAFGWHVHWGGEVARVAYGRRKDQHRAQVEAAIQNFYCLSGIHAVDDRFHSVEFILARVKNKVVNAHLNPNDNLFTILEVIREKTGVDYVSLDATPILNAYDPPRSTEPMQVYVSSDRSITNPSPQIALPIIEAGIPMADVSASNIGREVNAEQPTVIATAVNSSTYGALYNRNRLGLLAHTADDETADNVLVMTQAVIVSPNPAS